MDKQEINKKFYEMFILIEMNFGQGKISESFDMVEDFIVDVDSFDEKTFKEIFSGEFKQGKEGDKHTKLPAFFMFDILLGFVERKMPNGSQNVYQKRKAYCINKIKEFRSKAATLSFDKRFNPEYTLTQACKKDITDSMGEFYFDFHSIKDLDIGGSEVLRSDNIEDRDVFVYYADIPMKTYEEINGKMRNTETSVWHINDLAFREEKTVLEEEYIESMQEYANDIIDEITFFFDGVFPKNIAEAKFLIEQKGYSYQKDAELYKALEVRYDYLKEKTFENREKVELYTKNLSAYKKNSKIKPAKKSSKGIQRTGIFARFREDVKFTRSGKSREERLKTFDLEREKQTQQDKELIDVVIYQKRFVDGKKVMVQLDNSEYKVVRRR